MEKNTWFICIQQSVGDDDVDDWLVDAFIDFPAPRRDNNYKKDGHKVTDGWEKENTYELKIFLSCTIAFTSKGSICMLNVPLEAFKQWAACNKLTETT